LGTSAVRQAARDASLRRSRPVNISGHRIGASPDWRSVYDRESLSGGKVSTLAGALIPLKGTKGSISKLQPGERRFWVPIEVT